MLKRYSKAYVSVAEVRRALCGITFGDLLIELAKRDLPSRRAPEAGRERQIAGRRPGGDRVIEAKAVSTLAIGLIVFVLVFGSALLAMLVQKSLPEQHLSSDSKDVVKLGVALIATMSALVLSLLIASAKSSFDTRSNQLVQGSADVIMLDHALARYGPEAKDPRSLLKRTVAATAERFWPTDSGAKEPIKIDPTSTSPFEVLYDNIQALSPQNDVQRAARDQALALANDLVRERLLVFEKMGKSIPVPFLAVLVFWLCIIFASFGLFAPRNATVIAVLCVCSMSVAGSIFLILELDRSFEGLLQISGAPWLAALAQLGR